MRKSLLGVFLLFGAGILHASLGTTPSAVPPPNRDEWRDAQFRLLPGETVRLVAMPQAIERSPYFSGSGMFGPPAIVLLKLDEGRGTSSSAPRPLDEFLTWMIQRHEAVLDVAPELAKIPIDGQWDCLEPDPRKRLEGIVSILRHRLGRNLIVEAYPLTSSVTVRRPVRGFGSRNRPDDVEVQVHWKLSVREEKT